MQIVSKQFKNIKIPMYFCILIMIMILIYGCLDIIKTEVDYSSKYFPLEEGNTWYFGRSGADSSYEYVHQISDSFVEDNKIYYHWTAGENSYFNYDIRADNKGNIKLLNGSEEYLWFNFNKDSGSTYIYGNGVQLGENAYNYNVYIIDRNRTVEVPAGIFDSCIVLLFDIPQVVDEEMVYIFAPNIGLISIGYDGWYSIFLKKALINGNQIGEWK